MQWPDNKRVTYNYDETGALTRICGLFTISNVDNAPTECTSNTLIQIAYDDLGRTERWQGADAQRRTVYDYDGASRLTDLSHNGLSGEEVAFGFPSYNPASQILRRTITETTGAGDYLWLPDGDETDIYDPANGLNQYTRINTNIQPTYDPRGNMTNDGANSYVYDAINRLSASPSQGVTLGYDAGDRLWEVDAVSGGGAIRRLLYDGAAMIGEYSNGGTRLLRRYLHGPGVDAPIMCFNGGTAADQRCVPGATSSATDDWFMMLADERGPRAKARFR